MTTEDLCEKCKHKNTPYMVKPCIDCRGDINYFEPINNENVQVETTAVGNIDDMVNHPSHYTNSKIECIDVIEEITKPLERFEAYLTGTILKYLWRWKLKNGLEDLKKARWYLDKLIGKMEGEE